jgi:hypothetical protein
VPSRSVGIKSARIEPKLYGRSNPIELAANHDLIAMPLLETKPMGRLALLRVGRNCKTALQNQATCDVDSPTVHYLDLSQNWWVKKRSKSPELWRFPR